jgi:glycosyltransferase involved in cell wall biosynthesis
MYKVVHLIPYDGVGGVETAARSMQDVSLDGIDFRVKTIFSPSIAKSTFGTFNPLPFLLSIWRFWFAPPELLVVSLWRSCIVGLAVKILRPHVRLVLFLHCPNDVHRVDFTITSLTARFADSVWADSHETLARRRPKLPVNKGRVISFVTARIQPLPIHSVVPVFVFWGRINALKDLGRALKIFAKIQHHQSDARFFVIGPDGGDLANIRGIVDVLDLHEKVLFLGSKDFDQIQTIASGASFYLQTSEIEGMGMSVVEAMQFGLVPVVTPVGEIIQYAKNAENAVVISDDERAVSDVLELINNDHRYKKMREKAIQTWRNKPLYKDSVIAACREVLKINNNI